MKFAMYGSGAAGSVFASYLRKGGADIILIDRYEAHMKKVAEEGMHFTIHQEEDGGYKDYDYQLKGFRTYTTAADAAAAEGKVDVIIYMTKATQLEQAIQDSMPVVGDTTVAVSLINGLGNDDNLFKVFPKERCIIGSGVLGTALPEPAHCVSTPAGGVQMNFGGAVRSELTDAACAEMLKCYRAGGCDAYWRDGEPGTDNNIYKFIWKKVCVNATVNTVCAVLRLKIGEVEADPFGQCCSTASSARPARSRPPRACRWTPMSSSPTITRTSSPTSRTTIRPCARICSSTTARPRSTCSTARSRSTTSSWASTPRCARSCPRSCAASRATTTSST